VDWLCEHYNFTDEKVVHVQAVDTKPMMSSQLLVHFDPKLEIRLACDASAYGIGVVLSHKMPDGSEKPVGFASRTLTQTEKN